MHGYFWLSADVHRDEPTSDVLFKHSLTIGKNHASQQLRQVLAHVRSGNALRPYVLRIILSKQMLPIKVLISILQVVVEGWDYDPKSSPAFPIRRDSNRAQESRDDIDPKPNDHAERLRNWFGTCPLQRLLHCSQVKSDLTFV